MPGQIITNNVIAVGLNSWRFGLFPHSDPVPVDAIKGLLAAFTTYSLVALGEAHWLQQEADFLGQLLQHPDFARTVQTIVVEFGNAHYQTVVDRFVVGDVVTDADLRWVWHKVGGAGQAFESPIYAQFFHTVRAINQSLPSDQQLRILLGDPPVDWQSGQRDPAIWRKFNPRDDHYAEVVELHVLAQGQRALLIAGAGHFSRISDLDPRDGNVVQRLEPKYPGTVFTVVPHVIFDETMAVHQAEVSELEKQLAFWPIPALASVRGTWLGEIPAYLHFDTIARTIDPGRTERLVRFPYIGRNGLPITEVRLSDMVDALLYLGPSHTLTFTPPAPR
jgi:hypothetical protein